MRFVSELSKERIVSKELCVSHYKNILKSCYGETVDSVLFIENLCDVFSQLTEKPVSFFKNLNIVDIFCFLLDMRINSQGTICSLTLRRNEKNVGLELNLSYVREEIRNLYKELYVDIKSEDMLIQFECPSVNRLIQPATADYIPYIKEACILKADKRITIEDNNTAELLFDRISPKISLEIISKFSSFVEKVTGVNFLSRYGIKDQNLMFIPSLDSLIWFTKLLFNESLESFYENIFALSYAGKMTPSYIESCAIGEYIYFMNCLKKVQNQKSESPNSPEQMDPSLADALEENL